MCVLRSISRIRGWRGAIEGVSVGNGVLMWPSVFFLLSPVWSSLSWFLKCSCLSDFWSLYLTPYKSVLHKRQISVLADISKSEKTPLRSLPVGVIYCIGFADAFSAFLYCWKSPQSTPHPPPRPQLFKTAMPKGTAGKADDQLWVQSPGRTLVLWNSHPEAPACCWSLERPHWCGLLAWVSKTH